jgi:hypothetical protein
LLFLVFPKMAVSLILKNIYQELQTLNSVFKKYASKIANSKSTILKLKKLQLTILVVLGILVYHFISSYYIGKDQKTIKGKMHQKDFDKKFEIYIIVIHMFKYFLTFLNNIFFSY